MVELVTRLPDYSLEALKSFFVGGIHEAYARILEFENDRLMGAHPQR